MPASESRYLSGIDVSHYQGAVDWSAVARSGICFAFVKAADGADVVDPRFSQNWAGARSAGIRRGAYHFFRPGVDSRQQAAHFRSVVAMDDLALPPALDVEVTDGVVPAALAAGLRTWLEAVQAAFGCTPIVYTDPSFWRENVGANFGAYPLWLACYAAEPDVPASWSEWTFWQHSEAGTVSGVSGAVDLDCCALSREALQKLSSR